MINNNNKNFERNLIREAISLQHYLNKILPTAEYVSTLSQGSPETIGFCDAINNLTTLNNKRQNQVIARANFTPHFMPLISSQNTLISYINLQPLTLMPPITPILSPQLSSMSLHYLSLPNEVQTQLVSDAHMPIAPKLPEPIQLNNSQLNNQLMPHSEYVSELLLGSPETSSFCDANKLLNLPSLNPPCSIALITSQPLTNNLIKQLSLQLTSMSSHYLLSSLNKSQKPLVSAI